MQRPLPSITLYNLVACLRLLLTISIKVVGSWIVCTLCAIAADSSIDSFNSPISVNDPRLLQSQGADLALDMSEERLLGESIAKQLYKNTDYIDDPVLQTYVEEIIASLLRTAKEKQVFNEAVSSRFLWLSFLLRDSSINAFATPGGVLGVNLGLISQSRSRDEVAAVLAHELAHVFQRHIARAMAAEKRRLPLLIASMLLGAAAASKNPEAASAVLSTGQGLMAQGMLNFSRSMEREADRIGFTLLAHAGYNPRAFKSFFEKMQSVARLNDDEQHPYLRTHPLTKERISEMQDLLHSYSSLKPEQDENHPFSSMPASAPDTMLAHRLIAIRASILSAPALEKPVLPTNQINSSQSNTSSQIEGHYRQALSALKQHNFSRALSIVNALTPSIATMPTSARLIKLLEWEILVTAQKPISPALWEEFERLGMHDRAWLLWAAQSPSIPSPLYLRILQALQARVSEQPLDTAAWAALGKLYQNNQQVLRSFEALAESQAARFDYQAAVSLLNAAEDLESGLPDSPQKHLQSTINDSKRKRFETLLERQRRFEASQ